MTVPYKMIDLCIDFSYLVGVKVDLLLDIPRLAKLEVLGINDVRLGHVIKEIVNFLLLQKKILVRRFLLVVEPISRGDPHDQRS